MTLFFAISLWIILSVLNITISHGTFSAVRWNKRLLTFEPIPGVPTYETERKNLFLRSRNEETHDFNGEPLRISYHEYAGFAHFYDNDTKVTGVIGDIWTILSEHTNFTMVLKKWQGSDLGDLLDNGSFCGLLEEARVNKIDVILKAQVYRSRYAAVRFTPAFWLNGQRIFAFAHWKRDHAWMVKLFTVKVWFLVAAFIMILSLVSFVTQKVLIRYRDKNLPFHSLLYHFFNTFATLCHQGHLDDNNEAASRILLLTISLFCWLILISYSSCLIYSVARETFEAPFNDLESLLERTKIGVVVLNGSLGHMTLAHSHSAPIFQRLKRANRVTVASNETDLYHKMCMSSGKYAFFSGWDAVLGLGTRICRLQPVGISYYKSPTASAISKKVTNKKTLDIGIMKLREFGIIDALKKRYIPFRNADKGVRQTSSQAIDADHIRLLLTLFSLGIIASIVLCVAENMFAILMKRKSVKRVIRRFSFVE